MQVAQLIDTRARRSSSGAAHCSDETISSSSVQMSTLWQNSWDALVPAPVCPRSARPGRVASALQVYARELLRDSRFTPKVVLSSLSLTDHRFRRIAITGFGIAITPHAGYSQEPTDDEDLFRLNRPRSHSTATCAPGR
jgi:hypothetical protein